MRWIEHASSHTIKTISITRFVCLGQHLFEASIQQGPVCPCTGGSRRAGTRGALLKIVSEPLLLHLDIQT